MDLKQNIDNANELKNKVKLANTRIKETVIRGGGYDFKSLDKAPERITDLLGQYKKIATGRCNIGLRESTSFKVTILLNLSFKPRRLFFIISLIDRSDSINNAWFDTEKTYKNSSEFKIKITGSFDDQVTGFFNKEPILTEKDANLDFYLSFYGGATAKITEWIALE